MNTIYYATINPVKFAEAQQFFAAHNPAIQLEQHAVDTPEMQTLDQKLIALNKARDAWQAVQVPVLAEDAGVYFPRYNQFPGTLTKFIYQAIGMEGLFKLIKPGDAAFFQLHLVYYYSEDQYQVFKGVCRGSIVKPQRFDASESVPFDDIFVPEGSEKSYAELDKSNQKSVFNYRVRAFEQFARWYAANGVILREALRKSIAER